MFQNLVWLSLFVDLKTLEWISVSRHGSYGRLSFACCIVGGLASYTPSKVQLETTFELGVTNSRVVSSPTLPAHSVLDLDDEFQLKPAAESTTWSAESSADLLF